MTQTVTSTLLTLGLALAGCTATRSESMGSCPEGSSASFEVFGAFTPKVITWVQLTS